MTCTNAAFSSVNKTLALRLGVPSWVAPLVAPAVDLSVIGLLLGTRYLAVNGATPGQLRPGRRLLIFSSLVTLALNVADSIIAGHIGRAMFDAVGPLLLIGWAEVGPGLLAALAAAKRADSAGNVDPQSEIDTRATSCREGSAAIGTRVDIDSAGQLQAEGDLLGRARQEDLQHWQMHRRPISSDTLRRRLHIGAGKARDLVAIVRSEYGIGIAGGHRQLIGAA